MHAQRLPLGGSDGKVGQPSYPHTNWAGICVESGAEPSVVACNQALTYVFPAVLDWNLRPSTVQLRFGDNLAKFNGILSIRLPMPGEGFSIMDGHVVWEDVPLLHGIDVMRAVGLSLNFRNSFLS